MRSLSLVRAALGAAALTGLLVQGAGAQSSDNTVVWYSGPGTAAQMAPALDAWAKLHPDIKIQIVEAPGPDSMERVATEERSHHVVADLLSEGDIAAWPAVQEGLYQPFSSALVPNAAKLSSRVKPFLDKQQRIVPFYLLAYGIVVNTNMVKEADYPQTWRDVLKPALANSIGLHDPSVIGGGLVWYMVGQKPLGDAYFKQLVAAKPRVFSRVPEEENAVDSGQRAVIVPGLLQNEASSQNKGAPVKWIAPKDGVFFITYYVGVVHDAPHAQAAQQFLNYLLTPEVQRLEAKAGDIPVIPIPESPLDLSKTKFLGDGATTPAQGQNMDPYLKAGAALMGK